MKENINVEDLLNILGLLDYEITYYNEVAKTEVDVNNSDNLKDCIVTDIVTEGGNYYAPILTVFTRKAV